MAPGPAVRSSRKLRGCYTAGFAAEWNPWFSFHAGRAVAGTFNAYVTLARRWYVRPELSLYSRLELGTSTLLLELVGVDRYSTGLHYGGVIRSACRETVAIR